MRCRWKVDGFPNLLPNIVNREGSSAPTFIAPNPARLDSDLLHHTIEKRKQNHYNNTVSMLVFVYLQRISDVLYSYEHWNSFNKIGSIGSFISRDYMCQSKRTILRLEVAGEV